MRNSFTSDIYLKHKAYFDERLIQLLEQKEATISDLNLKIEIYKADKIRVKELIKQLKMKSRDLEAINYNLTQKVKEKDEELNKAIKDFEKEIKKQGKIIDDELQHSYKDNTRLHNENEKLRKEIERLRRENNKYKNMNKKNSANSSLPPSQNEYRKVVNSRTKSERKKGGQKGHSVHRSKLCIHPHNVEYKKVAKAPTGAEAVLNEHNQIAYYRTQQINAYLKTEIIETRYLIEAGTEALPEKEMKKYQINSVSYHDDFKALILYLNSKGTIALDRMCTMINEMSMGEIELRASTVVKWNEEFHKKSKQYTKTLLEELKKESVLHVDETGWRINGKRSWMHVIVSGRGAYYVVTEKRKDKETGPLRILEDYKGCLIHDHYKAYYDLTCEHGECNAHILRYLKAGAELDKNKACEAMIKLMQDMIHKKKELMKKGIMKMEEEQIKKYEEAYLKILNDELERYGKEHLKPVTAKYVPQHIKLMKRMIEFKEEHLRFIKDFHVPSENNIAERQMRPIKAKKKISGQSMNLRTANNFAAVYTVIQTCSLQKKNTLEEIKAILQS